MLEKIKKKIRTVKILLIVVIVASIGFGYYHSRFIAPNDYKVQNYTIKSALVNKELHNFKIGYISDLNIKDSDDIERLEKIADKINTLNCDMIIFGGDVYDSQIFDNAKVASALKNINSNYGKFAVLGEKDLADSNSVSAILIDGGFEVLHNEYRKIYYQDATMSLFGLEANSDIAGLVNDENKDTFKIVAVHEPDYFTQLSTQDIQLQLSGHSLGGYINIPFIGGILTKTNAKEYVNGKYTQKNANLIVSNGLGNESSFDYRFLCPNQIVVTTLQSK